MFKRGKKEHQKTIFDFEMSYPQSIREMLEKSWAASFYNDVFLNINEERFSVLYSDKLSRPNKPVNILVSLLILKELLNLTDDELIGSLYFDFRFQYALGINDFDKERLCINTLTNFRQRLVEYQMTHKRDLLEEEVQALSNRLADLVNLDRAFARMDSLFVESSCKKLTRLELVYTVVQNMVKAIYKLDSSALPESFHDFLKESHKTETLYRTKTADANFKLDHLIELAANLYQAARLSSCTETKEFKNLIRLLNEQCIETEEGILIPIEGKQINSKSLQNPSDPDATYRNKAGKGHVGYSLNVVEVRDQEKKVGLILSHDYQQNIHSDAQFGETFITENPLVKDIKTLTADGAYFRQTTVEKALENDIEFSLSQLTGRKVSENKLSFNEFKIDPKKQLIVHCPGGHTPVTAKYKHKQKAYEAKFSKLDCQNCALFSQCPIQEQKKYNKVRFTQNQLQIDTIRNSMKTERHFELAKFRAGVEGIPSALRRRFRIDSIPVRGFVRSKIWVNMKILAYNFRSVMKFKEMIA